MDPRSRGTVRQCMGTRALRLRTLLSATLKRCELSSSQQELDEDHFISDEVHRQGVRSQWFLSRAPDWCAAVSIFHSKQVM